VKRFKRLPAGSCRHWAHVVDARTGPGLKSMTKFKKRKEEQETNVKATLGSMTERLGKLFKKSKKKGKSYKNETNSLGGSSDESPPSPAESQLSDDCDETIFGKKFNFNYATRAQNQKRNQIVKYHQQQQQQRRKRKNPRPVKNFQWPANHFNLFMDVVNDDQWCQRNTCCGIIYECAELEAIIVDESCFKPCLQHQSANSIIAAAAAAAAAANSSDQPMKELEMTKFSDVLPSAAPPTTTTAIKKHQMFLKRHTELPVPSLLFDSRVEESLRPENSNKQKTEMMKIMTTDAKMGKQASKRLL